MRSLYETWAVRRLIADLGSPLNAVRHDAIDTLHDRHVETRPHLIELLSNSSIDVRKFAADQLTQQLPIQRSVIDAFISVATDESQNERVRWLAIFTFEQLGQQAQGTTTETDDSIIDALCTAVKSSNDNISGAAASALREYGTRAEVAASVLSHAVKREADIARVHAAGALIAVDPSTQDSMIPVLIEVAQSNDSVACGWALHFLGSLGNRAKPAIPVLKRIAANNPELSYHVDEALELIQARPDEGQ